MKKDIYPLFQGVELAAIQVKPLLRGSMLQVDSKKLTNWCESSGLFKKKGGAQIAAGMVVGETWLKHRLKAHKGDIANVVIAQMTIPDVMKPLAVKEKEITLSEAVVKMPDPEFAQLTPARI
ncbi:MAG: hypothetical protein JRJ85_27000 [Deltaproteobacteria bacterium]|nr:hypothetical protein [Deltaproteobacteria bacterium]